MAFDIFNYSGTKVTVPVDLESDEIVNAVINVYSGDEVLCVEDSKGKIDIYDSAELAGSYRDFTFYDGMTTIKKDGKMDEVWDNPAFRLRDRSEWYWQE